MCKNSREPLMGRCVGCGHQEAVQLLVGSGFDCADERYDVLECDRCHLARTHPHPPEERLRQYYTARYYGRPHAKFIKPMESLTWLGDRRRASELVRLIGAPAGERLRVLDVGCGRSAFLRILARKGHFGVGLEIPGFEFPEVPDSIRFVHGTMETAIFDQAPFDGVSLWHVLEHTRNPATTMQRVAEVLRPGGVVAVAVPHFGSLQRWLFRKHWFHLDMPRHLYHFRKAVLLDLLERNGLRPVKISAYAPGQNLFGFIQSALNTLFPRRPNVLYSLLKIQDSRAGRWGMAGIVSLALSPLLLLPAVLESVLACACGRGATLMVYARKDPRECSASTPLPDSCTPPGNRA